MKKKVILVIMLLCYLFVFGEEPISLNQVLKPDSLLVSNDYIYILEGAKCHIYAKKDKKIIKVIGKSGAGPGEVKIAPGFPLNSGLLDDGSIYLEGMNKLVFFSNNGKYLKEVKKKGRIFKSAPVGENFVGIRFTGEQKTKKSYISLALYNGDFTFLKELFRQEVKDNDRDIEMVVDSIHYSVYKNKIYVENSIKGFCVSVFSADGIETYKIKNEISPDKVTDSDKNKLIAYFKKDDFIKMMITREGGWDIFKKKMNFIYPKIFPSIQDISVIDDKIYILTFISSKNSIKEKFIIMDLKGHILKKVFLPVPIKAGYLSKMMGKDNKFYGFSNKTYYYLEEEEETEAFTLKKIEL